MLAEVKFEVERPETVRAEPETERPEPVRSLKDSPFTMRSVVEARWNEEYAVDDEYIVAERIEERRPVKLLVPENVFESERRVEDAAVPLDVSTQTTPDEFVLSVPAVVVERVRKPVLRLVEEAFTNEEYTVDEE